MPGLAGGARHQLTGERAARGGRHQRACRGGALAGVRGCARVQVLRAGLFAETGALQVRARLAGGAGAGQIWHDPGGLAGAGRQLCVGRVGRASLLALGPVAQESLARELAARAQAGGAALVEPVEPVGRLGAPVVLLLLEVPVEALAGSLHVCPRARARSMDQLLACATSERLVECRLIVGAHLARPATIWPPLGPGRDLPPANQLIGGLALRPLTSNAPPGPKCWRLAAWPWARCLAAHKRRQWQILLLDAPAAGPRSLALVCSGPRAHSSVLRTPHAPAPRLAWRKSLNAAELNLHTRAFFLCLRPQFRPAQRARAPK